MSAAARDIKNDAALIQPVGKLGFPIAAAKLHYAGTMVATNASGNSLPAGQAGCVAIWGKCSEQKDNSAGAAGALRVEVEIGYHFIDNDTTNPVTNAYRGSYCYAVDDHTVGNSDVGGTLLAAGKVIDVPASGQSNYGKVLVHLGEPSLYFANPELGGASAAFKPRGVVTSNIASLAAFTVASNDGLTYTAGQVALLVGQTTKTQNGPWVVGTVATGTAPLTRPDWYPAAGTAQPGTVFTIQEGTQGANSRWILRTTGAITIDTTATDIDMIDGNWVQGVSTAVGTMAGPSGYFFAAALLKPRLTGIFEVHLDVAWSCGTTADSVTMALVTDTVADGTGAVLASANKVAHGVAGLGAFGTRGSDWESVDTNGGAVLTYNGAAFSTAGVTQASEVNGTLTGLLTTNGSGQQKFGFHGFVYNAAPTGTTKTPFAVGNTVAFGVKVTATNTITVTSVRMTVRELSAQ